MACSEGAFSKSNIGMLYTFVIFFVKSGLAMEVETGLMFEGPALQRVETELKASK